MIFDLTCLLGEFERDFGEFINILSDSKVNVVNGWRVWRRFTSILLNTWSTAFWPSTDSMASTAWAENSDRDTWRGGFHCLNLSNDLSVGCIPDCIYCMLTDLDMVTWLGASLVLDGRESHCASEFSAGPVSAYGCVSLDVCGVPPSSKASSMTLN